MVTELIVELTKHECWTRLKQRLIESRVFLDTACERNGPTQKCQIKRNFVFGCGCNNYKLAQRTNDFSITSLLRRNDGPYLCQVNIGLGKRLDAVGQQTTVEPLYNTIVFHQNTHKRHPIARP